MMIQKYQEQLQAEQETWKTNLSVLKGRLILCARPDGHPLTGDAVMKLVWPSETQGMAGGFGRC